MKDDEIIHKVRGTVDGECLPSFLHGYDVTPGDIEGDPAVWVTFYAEPDDGRIHPQLRQQVDAIHALKGRLRRALLDVLDEHMPYIRVAGCLRQETAAN